LNKFFCYLLIFIFPSFLFATSLDDVEQDVQCYLNYGNRPISLGLDKYINSQGQLQNFGISTVAAINGEGFFCLEKDDKSIVLTRNGFFFWGEDGFLINHDGYHVLYKDSILSEKDYKYISLDNFITKSKKSKMATSLADKSKNDIESSPYLLVVPIKEPKIIDNEYILSTVNKVVSSEIIYGAREFNSMEFSELYDLCLKSFDEYRDEKYMDQKKRILAKFEVVVSHILNNYPVTTDLKGQFENKVKKLRDKIYDN